MKKNGFPGVTTRADTGMFIIKLKIDGRWKNRTVHAESEADAYELRLRTQEEIDQDEAAARPHTEISLRPLKEVADIWLDSRAAKGKASVDKERSHLRIHVLPALGERPVGEIKLQDALELMDRWTENPDLAPRTVHSIHGVCTLLWKYMLKREAVTQNPWPLVRDELPAPVDKDHSKRLESYFTRTEIEKLIGSPAIPFERRMFNGLLFLTGMRVGEAAGMRWHLYDPSMTPLGSLTVAYSYDGPTKTGAVKTAPVHPTLAAMLSAWRKLWPHLYAREPEPGDLICPGPPGPFWGDHEYRYRFQRDLKRLGLRVKAGKAGMRSPKCARGTFISLVCADGGRSDVIARVTHLSRLSVFEKYYRQSDFGTMCVEIEKLKIAVPEWVQAVNEGRAVDDTLDEICSGHVPEGVIPPILPGNPQLPPHPSASCCSSGTGGS